MALKECNECGGKVSDKAGSCPHCGAPIKLDEIYNETEKNIVTVRTSKIAITIICIFFIFVGLYWTTFLFKTTTLGIYSIIPLIISLLLCLVFASSLLRTHITLTNKRVTGKCVWLLEKLEIDYPLRQIKNVSSFEFFGISNFKVLNESQIVKIPFAVNGKKFKKEYFNLIENKYKY